MAWSSIQLVIGNGKTVPTWRQTPVAKAFTLGADSCLYLDMLRLGVKLIKPKYHTANPIEKRKNSQISLISLRFMYT